MKTKREFIKEIIPNKANFDYCSEKGIINGSLLADIERIMQKYANQQLAIDSVSGSFSTDDMLHFSNYIRNGITNLEYCDKTETEHLKYWIANYR